MIIFLFLPPKNFNFKLKQNDKFFIQKEGFLNGPARSVGYDRNGTNDFYQWWFELSG